MNSPRWFSALQLLVWEYRDHLDQDAGMQATAALPRRVTNSRRLIASPKAENETS
jgi:hypothetical protein